MALSLRLLPCPPWEEYELIDTGNGQKLERFGRHTFVRPEYQAFWRPREPRTSWEQATATYHLAGKGDKGSWTPERLPEPWPMAYGGLRFLAEATPYRHMSVFPEMAALWDWTTGQVQGGAGLRVLNLFGYTGLFSLALAAEGVDVTHVDASKKAIKRGRENQSMSGLDQAVIRWIHDDVPTYVDREVRRGKTYHGIIIDAPKFGHGTRRGAVWKLEESLPILLGQCRKLLAGDARFVIVVAYVMRGTAVSLYHLLDEHCAGLPGEIDFGEIVTPDWAGRQLSASFFGRWRARP